MRPRRVLLAASIFAVCGWAVFVSLSLWRARSSLSGLWELSFERSAVQTDETVPAAAAQVEIPPPVVVTTAEAAPAISTATISTPEMSLDAEEDEGSLGYSGGDKPIVFDSPASVEARCWLLTASEAYANERTHDDSWPRSFSVEEREAMAAFRDSGFEQLVYGERLRWWLDTSSYGEQLRSGAFHKLPEHPVINTIPGYYIRAVRSHTRGAAARLASLYGWIDKVEARAWLVVEEEMGGGSLSERERPRSSFSPQTTDEFTEKEATLGEFTEEEELASEARAEELIIEHNLFSGLGVPEECLTDEEVEEQRSRLSGLARRLAERAMPSEAPDAVPKVFNRLNGHGLVVENVCSLDCPGDTQRVIYYQDVPSASACSEIEGTELSILARSPRGDFGERRFCVPTFLVDN